ncbi:protein shisa-4 [Leucoraja erinacea]|uniref:protein shisa-4 n=1 Tax=Leucoraja erinaceus TaxID=7782 RepID=UPI0024588F61|nr:protein shisa-4 [Leucoraja erinacea]
MGLARGGGPLLAVLFVAGAVSADNDCMWYTDVEGNWHFGFDCSFVQFCCGNCTYRYCCRDYMLRITERQQKYCATTNLSPATVAGIASALFLFIFIIGIIVCCFLCSCCYLYRRRHNLRQQFTGPGQVIRSFPMQPAYPSQPGYPPPPGYPSPPGYPMQPGYPSQPAYPPQPAYSSNMPPGTYAAYPTAPAYGVASSREMFQSNPMNPAYPPNIPPGSYAPYPSAPAYSAASAPPHISQPY